MRIEVLLADWQTQQMIPVVLKASGGKIVSLEPIPLRKDLPVAMPGMVDAHVHIESSMLLPTEFARMAVVHGTVASISDPHEIANVCGLEGVTYMLDNAAQTPFTCCFGAPSCVPASVFETAGARLDTADVEMLLSDARIGYLSEMMNFPGVLNGDPEVLGKIAAARAAGKPADGHAPGLRGKQAARYAAAGISTDHECYTLEEAAEKLQLGMKILIREGSAARNFDALIPLLATHPGQIMFCSDDKHPDSLIQGHINLLCARAAAAGISAFHIIQAACINPVQHYGLDIGLLRTGDPADFILVKDLQSFTVISTFLKGILVASEGKSMLPSVPALPMNNWGITEIASAALEMSSAELPANDQGEWPVIEVFDGQLITAKKWMRPTFSEGRAIADTERDILKIVVVNRYHPARPALALITGTGLKHGAIASSVAHDSHNIVAIGTNDGDLYLAIQAVIEKQGGIAASGFGAQKVLPLPVAGLMSTLPAEEVAAAYTEIDAFVREQLGSILQAPFMSLSFMALLVIPSLKLSDQGLFDGDTFELISKNS